MSCSMLHREALRGALTSAAMFLCLTTSIEADELPLRRIVLFSAGVGFFQHEGPIDGNQAVEMEFDADEINDLLKSLVVQDCGDGTVSSVTYGARDPVGKTLRSLSIDVTRSPTVTDLLTQLRGCQVRVQADDVMEGTIVGVEIRTREVNNETRRSEFLNLLTAAGIQSVCIDSVDAVKLLDEKLEDELRQALSLIDQSRRRERKTVRVEFRGEGKRRATVGYIRECPVWKTSYRLVLREGDDPMLQGWSIVENTTDEDWENIALTLISGQPVSFVTELYEPLYVQRPRLMPQLPGEAKPRVHQRGRPGSSPAAAFGADDRYWGDAGGMDAANTFGGGKFAGRKAMGGPGAAFGGMGGWGGMGGFGRGMGGFPDTEDGKSDTAQAKKELDVVESVIPNVGAEEVGELFQYEIELPVSIEQDRSAMLPIVNDKVDVEKLSIYNAGINEKHPLNGLRLTNSTALHLMQGPITIFDDGAFAGDARIQDVPPRVTRLISYALDLDTDVEKSCEESSEPIAEITVSNGVVKTTEQVRRESNYSIRNDADNEKQLIIEQKIDKQYELKTRDALDESTADLYRFAVTVAADSQLSFKVEEQKSVQSKEPLASLDDTKLQEYLVDKRVPAAVKEIFRQLTEQQREIEKVTAEIADKDEQVERLTTAQARIRENMKVLDKTNKLYQQYLERLASQEEQLQQLNEEIVQLKTAQRQLEEELDVFAREASADQ